MNILDLAGKKVTIKWLINVEIVVTSNPFSMEQSNGRRVEFSKGFTDKVTIYGVFKISQTVDLQFEDDSIAFAVPVEFVEVIDVY